MSSFKVRVAKDYTVFCAGHFITYEGDKCEPLHGHNYRAAASIEGDLTEHAYVYNFVNLKELLRGGCGQLDHRTRHAGTMDRRANRTRAAQAGHHRIGGA